MYSTLSGEYSGNSYNESREPKEKCPSTIAEIAFRFNFIPIGKYCCSNDNRDCDDKVGR